MSTSKEVGNSNPSKVRKDSEFKGNGQTWPGLTFWLAKEQTNVAERLDNNPDQEKDDESPGVS
eukprot:11541428-Heterocapsa_arctica.AAC.1